MVSVNRRILGMASFWPHGSKTHESRHARVLLTKQTSLRNVARSASGATRTRFACFQRSFFSSSTIMVKIVGLDWSWVEMETFFGR